MTSRTVPPDPFDVVAKALKCPKESLSRESKMLWHHRWDSLGHVEIIEAIEDVLGIDIPDGEACELKTMKAICEFFNGQSRTNGE